ncbi:MAG: carbon-nitrogen hydrolase family protein [Candidatus Zipacnadales bacterium]
MYQTVINVTSLLLAAVTLGAEEVWHEAFEGAPREELWGWSWGDEPSEVLFNGVLPDVGRQAAGARLHLRFGEETPHHLSYWNLKPASPIPIVPQLQEIALWVKTNVPVSLKIGIGTFGFIYHGPTVQPSSEWQQLVIRNVFDELKAWCARGERNAEDGFVTDVIAAVHTSPGVEADIAVDDVTVSGLEGIQQTIVAEIPRRRFKRILASVVTLLWSDEGRSLTTVLDRLDEAGYVGSDIVCLPMECVQTAGEPIPGPLSTAIAGKAKQYGMWVIGNLRETEGGKTYVTSFLCNRQGEIVGKYRKSHKMPDEDMDLGNELPVFTTDFATIALRIGSDRFFADIDHVYTVKGARMIFWSQAPEPVEDEYQQDFPSAGRAADYNVFIACARYSRAEAGWITSNFPPYRGSPIGRSYIINREGERIASTTRKGTIATAVIPVAELQAPGRQANHRAAFKALTDPVTLPEPRTWAKRKIRVTAIENHVGIDDLLSKLDEAGRLGSDIVCTYELVWFNIHGGSTEDHPQQAEKAKQNLQLIAMKAKQWNMYVLVAGVIERPEINEAILYGRDGQEVGRYRKIATTYDLQVPGDETPVLETDFGRIGVRICADEWMVELDRCYGIKGADIIFTPTQSWGPDALFRNLRDISRAMDSQLFHVQATHSTQETMHRSLIIEPTGVPVARTEYRSNGLVTAVIDLDNDRPLRFIRNWKPHEPKGYLPEYQETVIPEMANDLKETILRQRRPELYQVLAPEPPTGKGATQ